MTGRPGEAASRSWDDAGRLLLTNGPVDRVATTLSMLRPMADEIVIAVDESSCAGDLGPILELAATAYSIFVGPVGAERVLNWLHQQCSSDWVMRIDSDEVPSASLLAALPDLVQRRDTSQYVFPRRWCYPDPYHWLDDRLWAHDWQRRLTRNIPGHVSKPSHGVRIRGWTRAGTSSSRSTTSTPRSRVSPNASRRLPDTSGSVQATRPGRRK